MRFKRALLVPVALLTALSLPWVVPASAANAAAETPADNEITIATWNFYKGNSTAKVVSGVRAIAKTADVIGLQELHSKSKRAALEKTFVDCKGCKYGAYIPSPSKGQKFAIFYNKQRLQLVDKGSEHVYDGQGGVEKGALGTRASFKVIVWVKLKDKTTGQSFYVLNTHMIPTVEAGGKPNGKTKRVALYRKHINDLADLADKFQKKGDPVFALGDFNVNYVKDVKAKDPSFPVKRLGAVGMVSNFDKDVLGTKAGPTHGSRYIDQVWWNQNKEMTPVSQKVLGKYGSDHKPVIVTMKLTKAKVPPASTTKPTVKKPAAPSNAKPTTTTKVAPPARAGSGKPTTTTTTPSTPKTPVTGGDDVVAGSDEAVNVKVPATGEVPSGEAINDEPWDVPPASDEILNTGSDVVVPPGATVPSGDAVVPPSAAVPGAVVPPGGDASTYSAASPALNLTPPVTTPSDDTVNARLNSAIGAANNRATVQIPETTKSTDGTDLGNEVLASSAGNPQKEASGSAFLAGAAIMMVFFLGGGGYFYIRRRYAAPKWY